MFHTKKKRPFMHREKSIGDPHHRFCCYSNLLISDKLINLLNLQMYSLLLSFFILAQ